MPPIKIIKIESCFVCPFCGPMYDECRYSPDGYVRHRKINPVDGDGYFDPGCELEDYKNGDVNA